MTPTFNVGPKLNEMIQTTLDQSLKKFGGVGITCAINWGNKTISEFASGYADLKNSLKMSSEMLFCICSIDKMMVASLILKLHETKKINLEESITEWLPKNYQFDKRITIRDLLNHTSGLWDFIDNPKSITRRTLDSVDLSRIWKPRDVIDELFLDKVYCNPGEACFYSSSNLILAGLIIEKITEMPLRQALKTFLLDPLGLKDIFITSDESLPSDMPVAPPWYDFYKDGELINLHEKPLQAYHSLPFISIYANVKHLVIFLDKLIQGDILSNKTMQMMLKMMPEQHEDWVKEYGLGIAKIKVPIENIDLIGHAGSYFGYMGGVFYIPQFNITMAFLENDSSGAIEPIAGEVMSQVIKLSYNTKT